MLMKPLPKLSRSALRPNKLRKNASASKLLKKLRESDLRKKLLLSLRQPHSLRR